MRHPFSLIAAAALLATVPAALSAAPQADSSAAAQPFDRLYHMMPHNSYVYVPAPQSRSGLKTLLDSGYRVLEIDIFNHPGDAEAFVSHSGYANDNGCRDGDHNGNFIDCLRDVKEWLRDHPTPEPISIFIDLKDGTQPWTWRDIENIENELHKRFGDALIIRPEEIIAAIGGDTTGKNLRQVIAQYGWPSSTALAAKGRLLFFYTAGGPGLYTDVVHHRGKNLIGLPCPTASREQDFAAAPPAIDAETAGVTVCGNLQWSDNTGALLHAASAAHILTHVWSMPQDPGFDNYAGAYFAVTHGAQFINRDDFARPDTFGGRLPLNGSRDAATHQPSARPGD